MTKDNDTTKDPVDKMIRDCSAEEFIQWLIDYHELPNNSLKECIISNLKDQFKWHRLQGRLDTRPTAAVIAEIFLMRADIRKLMPTKLDK